MFGLFNTNLLNALLSLAKFLANVIVKGPILLWCGLSYVLTKGCVQTPLNKKMVGKKIRPFAKLKAGFVDEETALSVLPDVEVFGVKPIARVEALKIIRALKLDPFGRLRYTEVVDHGNTDLWEIFLEIPGSPASVSVFVNNYVAHNSEYTDFGPNDRVALVMDGSYPLFIYNQATHVLVNCDFWDIHIKSEGAVVLHNKGAKLVRQVSALLMKLRTEGHLLDAGGNGARVGAHHPEHSYEDAPLAEKSVGRDVHQVVYATSAVAMVLAALYVAVIGF